LQNVINLCRISCQKDALSYKSQRGYCDIFHNPVLQLTFKNCILYGLPNRMILSAGEMPSFSTGYRLVTRVLHTHIFSVMTKHSVRHVIVH